MKKFAKWVMDNALIAIAMTLMGGVIAGTFQAQEISGTEYHVLAKAWPQLKPATQRAVRTAIEDGHISRWAYSELFRQAMDDLQVISFTPGLQVDVERDALKKILSQTP